jgi:two-component sensor histidine kinase
VGHVTGSWTWSRAPLSPRAAVAVGLALVVVAGLLRHLLNPFLGGGYAFLTFFLAVIAAAALGGFAGYAAALSASTLLAWYLFVPPRMTFQVATETDAVALLAFVFVAGLSGAIAAGLRRALDRLELAERGRQLLIDELNHRVKNTLSTVQSLAAQTARSAGSVAAFEQVFLDRLQALSRAHNLLTERGWRGAELGELIRATLAAHDTDGARISIEGPPIRLGPNSAVTVNLAVHELATNAIKYGALSSPQGRVEVRWADVGDAMEFLWRESGLQDVAPPTRQGFGSRLLRAAARELDAEVEPRHTPQGYVYAWRVPFSERVQRA